MGPNLSITMISLQDNHANNAILNYELSREIAVTAIYNQAGKAVIAVLNSNCVAQQRPRCSAKNSNFSIFFIKYINPFSQSLMLPFPEYSQCIKASPSETFPRSTEGRPSEVRDQTVSPRWHLCG